MGIFQRTPHPPFEPLPILTDFLSSPLRYLIYWLYHLIILLRGPSYTLSPSSKPLRVVCISDTHCKTTEIPSGDLLIHAGDLANEGTIDEISAQLDWLSSLPHPHKIVIAGNHDSYFDPRSRPPVDRSSKIDLSYYEWKSSLHYLEHSAVTLAFPSHGDRQLKIYGAPQIPACGGPEFAFQYPRGSDAWTGTVPRDIDILITHTPPKWHKDLTHGQGDEFLLREIWRVRPRLHVFGHVHADPGREYVWWDDAQEAYERVMGRGQRGIIGDAYNIGSLIDGLKILVDGALGILWNRVWGGEGRGGLMVNAALTVGSTNKLGNLPQVVYI